MNISNNNIKIIKASIIDALRLTPSTSQTNLIVNNNQFYGNVSQAVKTSNFDYCIAVGNLVNEAATSPEIDFTGAVNTVVANNL